MFSVSFGFFDRFFSLFSGSFLFFSPSLFSFFSLRLSAHNSSCLCVPPDPVLSFSFPSFFFFFFSRFMSCLRAHDQSNAIHSGEMSVPHVSLPLPEPCPCKPALFRVDAVYGGTDGQWTRAAEQSVTRSVKRSNTLRIQPSVSPTRSGPLPLCGENAVRHCATLRRTLAVCPDRQCMLMYGSFGLIAPSALAVFTSSSVCLRVSSRLLCIFSALVVLGTVVRPGMSRLLWCNLNKDISWRGEHDAAWHMLCVAKTKAARWRAQGMASWKAAVILARFTPRARAETRCSDWALP